MFRRLLPAAFCALAAAAHAHPGHGAPSEWHWHATDVYGFLALAAIAAIAIWLSRGE